MLLVNVFFSEVNWVYDMIHPESFLRMLKEWFMACASDSPPCPVHGRSGNSERRRSLSQFPSLLLQVLAMGLQSLPREHYKQMSQLNHGNVDFRTMAITLSNTACELATLLASSQATLPRVQQWFLRASFLKNDGRTIEAWHALGQGIREAQELGLHRESVGCYGTLEISSLWQREIERRTWANLYIWDR